MTAKTKNDNPVLNKTVLQLAVPIFLRMLLVVMLGYIDTIMTSNYNQTAVGAIGNANTVLGFLALAFSIISSATGIIVSQYLGADKKDRINQIYTLAVAFNFTLSILISGVIFFFSNQLLTAMQVPSSMINDSTAYMQIVGGLIFVQAVFETFSQIFASNGKTVIGLVIALGMNVLNIVGNYMFLYGPLSFLGLGTSGVAISTCVSRIVGLGVAIWYFAFVIKGKIKFKYLRPFPFDILKQMLHIGIPTAGENISYNLSQVVIAAFVNTMGIVAINARIYTNILCMFTYMIALSAASATQILVGHSIGKGDEDYAYKRVLKTLRFALLVSISIAVINWLLSPYTLRLFTSDSAIIALGTSVMLVSIFLEFGRTTNIVVINSMKATGDVRFPTILAIISMWGLSVLLAYFLGIVCGLGLVGMFIGMAVDEIFRGVVVFIRWIRGNWRGKRLVK